jgi:pimeloyl-ACP methyl ester carboxylesterase
MSRVERIGTRIIGFRNPEMDFQLMRSLGAGSFRGGEPGEIFAARGAVQDDPCAWPPAFAALGDRVRAAAAAAAQHDYRVTARDHFLRAAMYYRSAEYFADPFGADGPRWGRASRECFIAATKLMAERVEAVEIAFEGSMLPGYFMTPPGGAAGTDGARDGRTVLVLTGFDGTGEELYFQAAKAGLERGFNVLVGEGPGQVGCLRVHPTLTFRPDYEKPIAAMIDYALSRPEVAAERLAVYGISFGGYFVIRAGIHDRRIRALVVNSPIVDLQAYIRGFADMDPANPPPVTLADVDNIPDAEFPRELKLSFKSACRRFGVDSFAGWLNRLADFTVGDGLANIRCPTLAMAGAGEGGETAEQLERYCSAVSGPVTRRLFMAEEGADMHCQVGNLTLSNAVVYDWLSEVFRK